MKNKFEKIRSNILKFEYNILSIDVGGGGVKMGIYKTNPLIINPLLISNLLFFNIEGDKTEDNLYKCFKDKIKKLENLQIIDIVCTSMSNDYKIFKNWRSFDKNEKNNLEGILKRMFIQKFKLKYYDENDVKCHSIGCRAVHGILNKKISTFTLALGTSPGLYIIDHNGIKIPYSGGLIKKKKYLWETNLKLGSKHLTKNTLENKKNNNKQLNEWINKNKNYFINVWNNIIKPIFITGDSKLLYKWKLKQPPRFIFMAGGMSEWRLSGYISLMNEWLQSSSKIYNKTEIVNAPRHSALIGAACLPFL
tara:strand:- start:22754 stop:23674 length:921 start_codon:yes stop_codon:yes gene_type:complete